MMRLDIRPTRRKATGETSRGVLRCSVVQVLMLGVLLTAWPATSNAASVDELLTRLAKSPALVAAVEPPLREAERLKLPTALLISKTREGAAKRIPPAMVATVLVRLVSELKKARATLPLSLRTAANLESFARATLAGCPAKRLGSLIPAPVPADLALVSSSLRRVASLCTDLRAAGLSPAESGRLASDTVRRDQSNASLDGMLVRIIRHAGSPESARVLARDVSAALSAGASLQEAVGTTLANNPGILPSGLGQVTVPETSNQKASESLGSNNGVGVGGNNGNGNGVDKVPPGQAKDKTIPAGQAKKR